MANPYAKVRRQWKEIETERDLKAIWRGERFESDASIEDALRVYEMAIRVDGWPAVRTWAQDCMGRGQILNAQLVELAMRCTEQKDPDFFGEITDYLLSHSPPNYFRFWFALFTARHSHFGERLFRKQLNELSDFLLVKYRRWLHKILRKLRFRCRSPKELAIGAIAFGMYEKYDPQAYPSEVFSALIACHNAAKDPKLTKSAQPVSKAVQVVAFSKAAAKLGIWSITEGIRTSTNLPRTIGYLKDMAPCMTNGEILRALRAFDAKLRTASHKKASTEVVSLASYIQQRLESMDLPIEEWCKIYPYLESPALINIFETLIDGQVLSASKQMEQNVHWSPVLLVPMGLEGRHFRIAQVASYLLYLQDPAASLFQVQPGLNRLLSHPPALWPKGFHQMPSAVDWRPTYEHDHKPLFQLIRDTFPDAAVRQQSTVTPEEQYLQALRFRMYMRDLLDGESASDDIPVIFLSQEPSEDTRRALEAYLPMFSGAVLVLFQRMWSRPLSLSHVLHLSAPSSVQGLLEQFSLVREQIPSWDEQFARRKAEVDRELRFLRLGTPPMVSHIPQ